jgi:hypothetical protein
MKIRYGNLDGEEFSYCLRYEFGFNKANIPQDIVEEKGSNVIKLRMR